MSLIENLTDAMADYDSSAIAELPTDLWSDEPELESDLHLRQILLLISTLEWLWRDRSDFFAAGNLTIYFSPQQIKSQDFRGPDFFVVLDTERRPRKSWVLWAENGQYPNVIVEVLSDSTAAKDKGVKKKIYQDTFRTPEYFWFDPDTLEFAGFILVNGVYQPIQPNATGHLFSHELNLGLGVHRGMVRYFTPDGALVQTPQESAIQAEQTLELERQQKEAERQQKEAERQQKEAAIAKIAELEAKLREAGLEP
jgi:Uma2 family endonuclease